MSPAAKKAFLVFGISTVVVAIILCVVPVELFNGEVTWIMNGEEKTYTQNLSLSYFFGIGVDEAQLKYVKSFRLTGQGWMLAFIFIVGIPGLIAYRLYLKNSSTEE
jgi:hypothetical protein